MKTLTQKIFKKSSSTYYYASLFFPPKQKADVFTLYAFVRFADDLVDNVPQQKAEFQSFKSQTQAAFKGQKVENEIVSNFHELCLRKGISEEWVNDFLSAMESDLHPHVYKSYDQLFKYTYGSAEVVGLMMAKILDLHKESFAGAKYLSRAMQLVNFCRDVRVDLDLNRSYLPGIENDQVLAIKNGLKEYEIWKQRALESFMFLPISYRIPIQAALEMYDHVAQKLKINPDLALQKKVKPSSNRVVLQVLSVALKLSIPSLLKISRPRFWLYLTGPWLIGWIAEVPSMTVLNTWQFWYGIFYFTLPANLFLYGLNDYFDSDTDLLNTKKSDTKETHRQTGNEFIYKLAIFIGIVSGLPLFLGANSAGVWWLWLFFVLAFIYSAPSIRLKSRPILDSISNFLYITPAFAAYAQVVDHSPSFIVILAGLCWAAAMHLFSAIPDMVPDRQANINTTATFLDVNKSLLLCGLLWTFAIGIGVLASPIFLLGLIYPFICFWTAIKPKSLTKMYWQFPLINTILGAIFFWFAALQNSLFKSWLPTL